MIVCTTYKKGNKREWFYNKIKSVFYMDTKEKKEKTLSRSEKVQRERVLSNYLIIQRSVAIIVFKYITILKKRNLY